MISLGQEAGHLQCLFLFAAWSTVVKRQESGTRTG